MENIIVAVILIGIAVSIIIYLLKQKKKGAKCIGCQCAKQCNGNCSHTKTH